ncbi:MAG: LysR family transcriptional regulator [Actinobacteria bacterium]|uniref:Unannotated protein n=1 Tax=freshwater metagenome TaxID=449393 RepID=A0A6J7J0D6_9ZZZZ|nr:LysR family transcriptional regulator [Actinomycetota bacterium]MSW41142.1 LysR family transcriptional regulator [Actinomycetota bacterium]
MTSSRLLDGRLKIRHLILAVAVADHGTILRAAEHLRVTQPAVSRGLHELEEILQARLFERGPRGVRSTPAGDVFLEHARAVVAQLILAGERVKDVSSGTVGTVTVGTTLAGTNRLLPMAVESFKREYPRAGVVIHEATPDSLGVQVLGGSVDLVVGRITAEAQDPRIERVSLYREQIRVVVARDHAAASLSVPTLESLVDCSWIMPVAQTSLRGELERAFEAHGIQTPHNRIECTSILTLRTLIADYGYVGVLPELVARDDERLVMLPIRLEGVSRTVGFSRLRSLPATPVASAFITALRKAGQVISDSLLREG